MSNSQISTHGTQKEDDNAVSDIYGVHPCAGNLVALRTRAEVEASNSQSLVLAYAVEIPPRSANDVLKALDAVIRIEGQGFVNVQHLRRIVRPQDLPPRFRDQDSGIIRDGNRNTQFTFSSSTKGLEPLLTDKVQTTDLSESLRPLGRHQSLFLFICLASILPVSTIESTLSAYFHSPSSNATPTIFTILVPLLPPSSESEAKQWSDEWWPTVYKKHNPFGPQPSAVAKAEAEIYETAGLWMGLARRVAEEVKELEIGEKVGAVVVDRHLNGGAKIVAIAGDARWNGKFRAERAAAGYGCGNAMAHAVIRAIGLVARKRREALHFSFLSNSSNATSSARSAEALRSNLIKKATTATESEQEEVKHSPATESTNFAETPLTPLETHFYTHNPIPANGYLCLDLDIYVTHEPCIMCSMAILHSRFGRVIFGEEMPRTGGMSAEVCNNNKNSSGREENVDDDGYDDDKKERKDEERMKGEEGLRYGLFWRPELNWKLLAWRWVDERDGGDGDGDGNDGDSSWGKGGADRDVHA